MPSTADELEAVRQELAALNFNLGGYAGELAATRVETAVRVEGLRAEQNQHRRHRMAAVTAAGVIIIYVTDEHIEHCSPGARTAAVFNASERGITNRTTLQHIYDHPASTNWCDVTVPWHSHSAAPFPTPANVFGMAALGVIALTIAIFHRWRTRVDFGRVQRAAQMEKAHAPRDRGSNDRR